MGRCKALTSSGSKCKKQGSDDSGLCFIHSKMKNNGKHVQIAQDQNIIIGIDETKKQKDPIQMDVIHVNPENQSNNLLDVNNSPIRTEMIQNEPVTLDSKESVENVRIDNLNNFSCLCCLQFYPVQEMIGCCESESLSHKICRQCASQYIEILINEKKPLCCVMGSTCENRYKLSDLGFLDEKILNRYKEHSQVEEATRFASMLNNYHICPFCSKYGVIVDNAPFEHVNNIRSLHCENIECGYYWCIKCRKEYHGNEPCNKIYLKDVDKIKKTIDETIDEAMIHKCPKCYTKYSKEDGCNLMTCSSCHTYSCYVCNEVVIPVNGMKYHHFHAPGAKCPLYNTSEIVTPETVTKGNIDYNNRRVITALKNLLELNKDNPEIHGLIMKDLGTRGFKEFIVKPVKKVVRKEPKKIVKTVENPKQQSAKQKQLLQTLKQIQGYGIDKARAANFRAQQRAHSAVYDLFEE